MKNNLCLSIFLYFVTIASFATTIELPKESSVPGGVAIISINSKEKPEAYFYDQRVILSILPWLLEKPSITMVRSLTDAGETKGAS